MSTKTQLEDLALRFSNENHRGVGVNAMTYMIDRAMELGLDCERKHAAERLIAMGREVYAARQREDGE